MSVSNVHLLVTDYGALPVPAGVAARLDALGLCPPGEPAEPHWASPEPDRSRAARRYADWLTDPTNRELHERRRKWERTQCRLAGEAWAKGETHTITAEGLGDAQAQVA